MDLRRFAPALVASVALGGCGDTMNPSLDPVQAFATAEECWVSGAPSLDHVLVSPAGGEAFLLSTDESPAQARVPLPEEDHGAVEVRVQGAIAFQGELPQPSFSVVADVETAGGMVHIRPGTFVNWSHIAPGGVRGVVSGTEPSEFWSRGEQLGPVTIPCAALSLDPIKDHFDLPATGAGDGTRWVLHDSPMLGDDDAFDAHDQLAHGNDDSWEDLGDGQWFQTFLRDRARPTLDEATALSQHSDGSGHIVEVAAEYLTFERVTEERGWMKVEAQLGAGTVTGWLPARDLVRLEIGFGMGGGGFSSVSCCGAFRFPAPDVYRGPAQLREGARIYATQDLNSSWATVVNPEAKFYVQHKNGEPWVTVTRIPGLVKGCGDQDHAVIPLEDVFFPPSALDTL